MKMMLHSCQLWSSSFIVWVCTVLTWGRSTIHNSISLLCKQGRNINPSWAVFCANFELVNLKECNTRILQQIILNYKEVTYTFQCVELIAKPGKNTWVFWKVNQKYKQHKHRENILYFLSHFDFCLSRASCVKRVARGSLIQPLHCVMITRTGQLLSKKAVNSCPSFSHSFFSTAGAPVVATV